MSFQRLAVTIDSLPHSLADQVLGYARSLELAAPEIFRDANVRKTKELTGQLVFIAGIRKLFSIIDSNYWVLDNAGAIFERNQDSTDVRIGGADFSREGRYHRNLRKLRKELLELLAQQEVMHFIDGMPYVEVVRSLSNGR